MNIVLSICAVIVTITFAWLAYSIIRMLKHVRSTLGAAHSTLEEAKVTISDLREEVGQVSQHTSKVIQHTNAITLDVQKKMKDLDIWFGTFKEVGKAVHSLTTSFRQTAAGAATKARGNQRKKAKAAQGLQQTTRQAEQQLHTNNQAPAPANLQAMTQTAQQPLTPSNQHTLSQTNHNAFTYTERLQAHRQAEGQAGPSNMISAIADGIASSIRIWNHLKQSNKSVQ